MPLLESDKMKLEILRFLYENPTQEMTIDGLRSKIKTAFTTVKKNCEFLEIIEFVTVERKNIGGKKRQITFIKLTKAGIMFQQKIATSKEALPY
ncbi:MAG: hypothetical protein QXX20_05220 [Candidatus Thermoplasmatota archaeon]